MSRQAQAEHVHAAHDAAGETTAPAPAGVPLHPAPLAGLTVGHVDDPAEIAAEARAVSVLGRLRRYSGEAAASAPQPSGAIGAAGGAVDASRTAQIGAAIGGGSALPNPVKGRMEAGFGTSLDHVRVHDGPEAARHSAALGAEAFTIGNDIFLGTGPASAGGAHGEHVLAHEIAHVVANDSGAYVRRTPPTNPTPKALADTIANGHSYNKHVVQQSEYTAENITDVAGFSTLIQDVIENGVSQNLTNGRVAYWKDRTVVIYNPNAGDLGTAFAPTSGKTYYDNLT